jgi:hypothetical protein
MPEFDQPPINPYAGTQNTSNTPNPSGPVTYQTPSHPNGGDSTGGLIPYKNPKALFAYYLGILSGLPLIGLPLGIAAFVLGIMGLNDRKKNPAIKGSVHAGIGIGCGLIFTLLWGGVILMGIIVAIASVGARR